VFEIGDTLHEARNRKGLSLRDVEDATKIRSRYLQALENDDFEVIPGPAFVKGFLRTYALYLGLDADQLVNEYRTRYEHPAEAQRVLTARPQLPTQTRAVKRRRPGTFLVGFIALAAIVALAWVGWGNRTGGQAEMNPGPSTTTSAVVSATTAPGTAAGTGTSTSLAPEGQTVAMVLSVSKDRCFLTVREDTATGKTLFSGTLDASQKLAYEGQVRYWLNVGEPSVLMLTINGTRVTVPEPYGQFVVTSAGITRVQ
jgi:cytoskeleton protein RodZ